MFRIWKIFERKGETLKSDRTFFGSELTAVLGWRREAFGVVSRVFFFLGYDVGIADLTVCIIHSLGYFLKIKNKTLTYLMYSSNFILLSSSPKRPFNYPSPPHRYLSFSCIYTAPPPSRQIRQVAAPSLIVLDHGRLSQPP